MSDLICKVAEPSDNEKLGFSHFDYCVCVCVCPTSIVHSVGHYPVYSLDMYIPIFSPPLL